MSAAPKYEFEAAYHYAPGERYNNGRGLSAIDCLEPLQVVFDNFLRWQEPYALIIRRLDTGEVVRSHGDFDAARKSMYRALRVRAVSA